MESGLFNKKKLVIAMAGLPARGKTYISRKLARYLNWIGYTANVFNIANFRKSHIGVVPLQYLDPTNKEASQKRQSYAHDCLDSLINFLKNGGDIALYDGSNTTKERRINVKEYLEKRISDVYIMWIELICEEEEIIENNIRQAKIKNQDFEHFNEEEATKTFKEKLKLLSPHYETLVDNEYENISYVKIINVGKEVEIHNIDGYLQAKILQYLMNLHIYPKPIYFARTGETYYHLENRIGGDSDLTEKGKKYCQILSDFFQNEAKTNEFKFCLEKPKILTNTLLRGIKTAGAIDIGVKPIALKILDEISMGLFDGMNYQEIKEKYPEEFSQRHENKLDYRFPRGESYLDLIHRIEPLIFEIERSRGPIIVVSSQSTIRCIYGYFAKDYQIPEIPSINIPAWTVIKLTPETYYCKEARFSVDVENNKVCFEEFNNNASNPKKKSYNYY